MVDRYRTGPRTTDIIGLNGHVLGGHHMNISYVAFFSRMLTFFFRLFEIKRSFNYHLSSNSY